MSPANAFEITATEVEALSEDKLVRLANRLIWDEGRRLRLPPNDVNITLRTSDPDGGVDALTNAGDRAGHYMPAGRTAWQFKKRFPRRNSISGLFRGSAVQEAFQQGAGYTLIVGQGMAPRYQRQREAAVREAAIDADCRAQVRLFVADHVAEWASNVPAALFELRPAVREYYRADQFLLRDPRHTVAFEPDEVRSATIQAMQEALFGEDAPAVHARIQGMAGVGKTRLALELVKEVGLDSLTLYTPNVPSQELFGWVAANENVQATVIVDECDEAEAVRLQTLTYQCAGRLRLITVGVGSSTGPQVYPLGVLDQPTMERVVRSSAATLTPDQVRWVAEKTQGYVKLAVVVAQAIARGSATLAEMSSDLEFRSVISKLLIPSEEGQLALKGVALLTRVGYDGPLAEEGEVVARFMGIDWNRMQMVLGPALAEGIVVKKGRYWYVSPELLALWLAAEVWRTQAGRVAELMAGLPNEASKDALLERLSGLGAVPEIRSVLEELIGTRGPFEDIESIDSDRFSRLFYVIGKGVPEAAASSLARILNPVSHDRLLQFGRGRRNVMWTLESLLERRDTFFTAARLMRKLAEAENEGISNNATGVWGSIFLTFLGRTEVPAIDRFELIEEALGSDSQATRMLGVHGLAASLQGHEFGQPLGVSGGVPPRQWRPQTWGEVRAVKRAALTLLKQALGDTAEEVRREAMKAFTGNARSLVLQGLGDEVVSWFEELDSADDAERRTIWESSMDVLKYAAEPLSAEQRQRLDAESKRFYGEGLSDRIKRYTGRWSHVDWPPEGEPEESRPESIARTLADEAFSSMDEVRPLLPWLVSGQAENIWPFAHRLGQLDSEHRYLEWIADAARGAPDSRLLSGYLTGRAEAGEQSWREELLDDWSQNDDWATAVFDATVRGPATDRGANRLIRLVDEKGIRPAALGWLQYGGWVRELSQGSLLSVVARLTKEDSPQALEAALSLVSDWLGGPGHGLNAEVEAVAWDLLGHPSGWGRAAMLAFYWKQLAARLLPQDPARIARLIVKMHVDGETLFHDERLELLGQALSQAPAEVWDAVGDALLDTGKSYRLAWALEETGFLVQVPHGIIIDWVGRNGEEAAGVVAQAVKPGVEGLPELVRFLIKEHGDSAGDALAANFRSGMSWGSEVAYLESKLEAARRWERDEEPAVRNWAKDLVRSLEHFIREARVREEEENLV